MVWLLKYAAKLQECMLADIEEIVSRGLGELCPSCVHRDGCVFRKDSDKVVIQCEQFEVRASAGYVHTLPEKGLCLNCDKAPLCHLPKETSGVWRCEEYE